MNFKLYRGIVVDNKDPDNSGRVKVRIFEIHGVTPDLTKGNLEGLEITPDENLPYAEVMQPIDFIGFSKKEKVQAESFAKSIDGKGSSSGAKTLIDNKCGNGYNRILDIGVWVFCILENNNPNYPIVIGTMAAKNEYTKSTAARVYESPTGHYEEFNDETGAIILHNKNGNEVILDSEGFFLNSNQKLNIYAQNDLNIHSKSINEFTENKTETLKELKQEISGSNTQKIGGSQTIEAQSQTFKTQANQTFESGAQTTIKGGSMVQIKGSIIMLG